jgi:cation diffusion facilitator CzcD-associated flavoprotein CzcO
VTLETNYYEVYNQPSVHLGNLRVDPIERIQAADFKTSQEEYDLDILIFATGFDALTGSTIMIPGPNGAFNSHEA